MKELWLALAARLGLTDTAAAQAWPRLVAAYATPPRAYHNLDHIAHCLAEFATVRYLATAPNAVEAALWFHDAVYDPQRHDNEAASAEFATQELAAVDASLLTTVQRLIRATTHAQAPTDTDEALMLDVDLAILGQPAAQFDAYERGIREEYAWVPDALFREKRAEILRGFLARPSLYHTPALHTRYEAAARTNLQRSLQRLVSL